MLCVMVLVWGVNYIVIKASLREITPLAFNAVRFGLAASVVALIARATVCWTFYIVGVNPLADRYGAVATTAWTMGLGAIPLLLYSIPAVRAQPWRGVSAGAWGGLLLSSMGALVVAYLIWFRG